MGLPAAKPRISESEYLRIERQADFRSEYYRGEMFAMAGGSPRHSRIKANLIAALLAAMPTGPCLVYDSDLRIKSRMTGLYTYPDASIICGELEFDDEQKDTVTNPTVIFEVLSESTEAYDRGKKFELYRRIPSLREYIVISQDNAMVERFVRAPDASWLLSDFQGLDSAFEITSTGANVRLRDIYDRIELDPT